MKNFLLLIAIPVLIISCGNGGKNNTVAAASDSVAVQQPTVYEHEYLVKVGDVAPDFTLPLTNGGEFSLSAQRGKVVMLQFTASWCGICRREMPHIEQRIWQPNKNNPDFVLIGIDREETKEVVDEYVAKLGTTYPMALDTVADVFASYALRESGITRNVLIGRDGRIVKLTRRFVDEEFNDLVATIDSLLAK